MLHEPALKEQQQQQQPKTTTFATALTTSNIFQHHVAASSTILPKLSNQLINTHKTAATTWRQHVANKTNSTATMLLVVGLRKIGAPYLSKKPKTLLAADVQPTALQQNVDDVNNSMLRQQDAADQATTPAKYNSKVAGAFNANSNSSLEYCTNAAGKMLLVHSNINSNNNNNKNNNYYHNDDTVEHLPQYAEPDPAKITIDFNRRRRRGRLRCDQAAAAAAATTTITAITTAATLSSLPTNPPPPPPTAPTAAFSSTPTTAAEMPTSKTTTAVTTKTLTTATTTSSPAYISTFFSMLLLLAAASMKLFFASSSKMLIFFRKLAVLALQPLYAHLRNYVNTITTLVLSSTTTITTAAAAADKQNALAAASSTSAAIFAIANNKYIHHRNRNTLLAAAAAAQQRIVSHGNYGSNNCCCYKQLIYVFLIFTNILPRNSNNLYAEAAKPKSATQTHQHQQQHQQQQQQQQSNTQLQPYNVGGNGVLSQPDSYQGVSSQTSMEDDTELLYPSSQSEEQLFDEANMEDENAAYETPTNATHFANTTVIKTPLFPKDLFTKQQLEDGWVFCHILGVIYMFVALAIVCDEFFVPSLDVIIEKLDITDDVAGATFMAAGGSAPELFTSVIGVFVSFDDVGIGTIVGSAVFNILFVIGMCALFSKTVLTLTWWPLFRDCTFYSISLIVLIIFFRDNKIYWYEALILFTIYICYVAFMKWNVQVERFVKKLITRNQGNAANSSETSMATQPGGSVTSRAASETRSGPAGGSNSGATGNSSGATASSTQTGAKFRHGLLQLMIHTIDPLHDGKVDEKATQLHAIASLKVLLDATKPQRGGATTSAANHVKINLKETTLADRPNGNIDTTLDSPSLSGRRPSWIEQRVKIQTRKFSIKQTNEIEDEPEPLSMAWPDTARKRLTYILVAPLLIPMWLTLPDTRSPRGKKFFAITFVGSIVWIAAFSYLMVWWANVAGETAKIPPEVMGLTFLAAGTSIPDLITSVIVARKGYGDMAVSSSVGSNIFDVTVGLPIPWLLYGLIYGAPVEVNSVGMVCSITILFMMLLFVVMSIACFRWRMNKGLGFTMFLLYFVFVAVSLMFEYDVIRCPV